MKKINRRNLQIAMLLSISLLTSTATQAVEDYKGTYGTGSNSKYYEWVTDSNGNKFLQETTEDKKDITVNYIRLPQAQRELLKR